MSYTALRVQTQAISASPLPIADPGIIPQKIMLFSTAAILIRGGSGSVDASFAANTWWTFEIEAIAELKITNTAAVTVVVQGKRI